MLAASNLFLIIGVAWVIERALDRITRNLESLRASQLEQSDRLVRAIDRIADGRDAPE